MNVRPNLEEIERQLSQITPGEWNFNGYSRLFAYYPERSEEDQFEDICYFPISHGDTTTTQGMLDSLFIENAPKNVQALLTYTRSLEARLKVLEQQTSEVRVEHPAVAPTDTTD